MSPLEAAWHELVGEVGECEIENRWCTIHKLPSPDGPCHVGRALDDMASAVESIIGRGGAHARNGCPHCTPDDTVPAIRCMRCGTACRDEA